MTDERLVFLDLETAGLETWRPIIQIAAIATTSSLRELESFETKVHFDKRLAAPNALRKNHYDAMLWQREGISAREAAQRFAAFLKRHATVDMMSGRGQPYQVAQLVAHNASFDGAFVQAWFERLGLFLPGHFRLFCTMQRAAWLFHEDKTLTPPTNYKLGTLCEYFGVQLRDDQAHDALADVRATVELYRAMTAWCQRRRAAA